MFFVFFFQAEDGIRDKLVTGVQTCALPISGGIMNILVGLQAGRQGYDRSKAERLVSQIPTTLHAIFSKARAEGLTTAQAADALAEARLREAKAQRAKASPQQSRKPGRRR